MPTDPGAPPAPATDEVTVAAGRDAPAVERLLRSLPDWFGLEDSLLRYVEAADRLPGFLARTGDGVVVGVVLVERHFP